MYLDEKMGAAIVRDCLSTARGMLPSYASPLDVPSMPAISIQSDSATGVSAPVRHMIVAALRVAALRSRSVDYRSGFMPDVHITRVHASARHAVVYCETNTGYWYKVECKPVKDTVSDNLTPWLMAQGETFEYVDNSWGFIRRDYVNLV